MWYDNEKQRRQNEHGIRSKLSEVDTEITGKLFCCYQNKGMEKEDDTNLLLTCGPNTAFLKNWLFPLCHVKIYIMSVIWGTIKLNAFLLGH